MDTGGGSEEREIGLKTELTQRLEGRTVYTAFRKSRKTTATRSELSNCYIFLISFQGKKNGKCKYGLVIFNF